MAYGETSRSDRIKAAAGTALLQGALFYALIAGLWTTPRGGHVDDIKLFEVAPEPEAAPSSSSSAAR